MIEDGSQHVFKGVRQFNTGGKLWLQKWIAHLVSVLVDEKQERVQLLVYRSVNSPANVGSESVVAIQLIGNESSWKQVIIAAFKAGVRFCGITELLAIIISVFKPEARLHVPFTHF